MHIAKLQVLLEHSEVPGHFNLSHRTSTVYTYGAKFNRCSPDLNDNGYKYLSLLCAEILSHRHLVFSAYLGLSGY
jgi:hypothetical protein